METGVASGNLEWAKWERKGKFSKEDKREYEEFLWGMRGPKDITRHGRRKGEILTPVKSIRKKCLDCCCGSKKEVRLCTVVQCWLHPFRFGKRPQK